MQANTTTTTTLPRFIGTVKDYIHTTIVVNSAQAFDRWHENTDALDTLFRITGKSYVFTMENELRPRWDCEWCERSGKWTAEGTETVYVRSSYYGSDAAQSWNCEDAENESFQCDISGLRFAYSYFSSVYVTDTGQTACSEYCLEHGEIFERHGEYYSYDEEDDGDDDYTPHVFPYGSAPKPDWWKHAVGYGIELELYADNHCDFAELAHSAGLVMERDSSLSNSINGIECIGGPYSLADYHKGKTPWNEALSCNGAYGVFGAMARRINGHEGMYGMHVSASRALFKDDEHIARFSVLMNRLSSLCRKVAQRQTLYSAQYAENDTCEATRTYGKGKYNPVNLRAGSGYIEVRIFLSNTRMERLLKNVEFVDAMRAFSAFHDDDYADTIRPEQGQADFLAFTANNKNEWPNLYSFLVLGK